MDFAELKNKSEAELKELLAELQTESRELRFKGKNRQLKQVHRPQVVRRTIARINVLLKQK